MEAGCGSVSACIFTGCADTDAGLVTTAFTGSLSVTGTVLLKVTDTVLNHMHTHNSNQHWRVSAEGGLNRALNRLKLE